MAVSAYVLSLAILTSSHLDQEPPSFTVEDLLHQPFVELLAQSLEGYSMSELKALRSRVERERDQQLEELAKRQKMWERRLDAARDELESLNSMASRDTEAAALRRSHLHAEIAALERSIREKAAERERTMPAKYEYQLTRLWLAEHWPGRRREILERIGEGEARTRRHGDVDDIGYRELVKNPEQDIETGQQAARQMTAGGWLPAEVQDIEVQAYVRQVAATIAANSDLKVPLRVMVLDSSEPKAMSLPGGFLYITSGAIRTARTESELAGVLAREIARIAARHGTRSSKLSWISRLFVPVTQVATGIFTSGVSPAAYYGIGYGVDGLGGLVGRMINGTNEGLQNEADQLGIQYAWKAGYDPRGFIAFLDSLSPTPDNNFLSDEPRLNERLLNAFSEIQYLPEREGGIYESGEFDRVRSRLAR